MATFVTSSIKSHHKERMTQLVGGLSVIGILGLAVTGTVLFYSNIITGQFLSPSDYVM